MSREFRTSVVTASDLRQGCVVYLTEAGDWSRDIAQAAPVEDEAEAQIRLIEASQQTARVVGAYLAEVRLSPQGPQPVQFREAFRARGSSVGRAAAP